jgi:hypothetical protein
MQDCHQQCRSMKQCLYGTYIVHGSRRGECWLSAHAPSHPFKCGVDCHSFVKLPGATQSCSLATRAISTHSVHMSRRGRHTALSAEKQTALSAQILSDLFQLHDPQRNDPAAIQTLLEHETWPSITKNVIAKYGMRAWRTAELLARTGMIFHKPAPSPTLPPTHPYLTPAPVPKVTRSWRHKSSTHAKPTMRPTHQPHVSPTLRPTPRPHVSPTLRPTPQPHVRPTLRPTPKPPSPAPTTSSAGALTSFFAGFTLSGEEKEPEMEPELAPLSSSSAPADFQAYQQRVDALHRAENTANNQF